MSLYTFRPKATLVHRENHGTLFFLSLTGEHIWMFGQYFICARPTNALHQFLLAFVWKSIDLLDSQHFWTLTVKKQISSQREGWFVSILAACQVCNSKPHWTPRWTEAISAGQTDESKASNEISAGVCLSGQNGNGELSVKEVFGLDSVSLLLMHKAQALFGRPLTSLGRAKPVKQRLSEYLPSLTKRGARRSHLIIQDLGLARKK